MTIAEIAYSISQSLPSEERYGLTSQIRRSAVSIPANIAEGSQRGTNKDFAQFISISKGSLAELETHILLAHNVGYFNEEQIGKVFMKTTELSKILRSFYGTLKN